MVNGDNAVPPSVEDVSSSTHIDQTPTVPHVEAEPAPQVEAKVSHELFSPSLKPLLLINFKIQPWVPRLHPLIESAKKILPQRALRVMT